MKKILLYTALVISAMLALSACSKDITSDILNGKEGGVSISVALKDQVTRALNDEQTEALLATTKVKIYKPLFEGLIREYNYADMPEVIYLPATANNDKYRIDVTAGEVNQSTPAIASWDSKSYKGSAEFSVVAGSVSEEPVTVEASISNAITVVTFDNETSSADDGATTGGTIAKVFNDGYTFTIGFDENSSLIYNAENSGQEGYFIIADGAFEPTLNWTFTGIKKSNSEEYTTRGNIAVEQSKKYTMNLVYNETDGSIEFKLKVDKTTDIKNDQIEFVPTSTGLAATKKSEIWATHAPIYADVDITTYDAQKVYFDYREKGTDKWIRTNAATETLTEGQFSYLLTGLTPNRTYEYQLVLNTIGVPATASTEAIPSEEEIIGGTKEITTKTAPEIPNASFEHTSIAESQKYPSFYDPNATNPMNQGKWWDSGNAGSGDFGFVICDVETDTSNVKDGQKSARLQSAFAYIKFAAGNLFTGEFKQVVGTEGGIVDFGQYFVGRPSKIKFWVKYNTGKVTTAGEHLTKNDYDIGQIRVALGRWTTAAYGGGSPASPVRVNTTDESTFVDFNTDPATIAYADLQITTADGSNYTATINGEADTQHNWNGWVEVTIPLEYSNLTLEPTHIIISCAASKYGDYFEGCEKSVMWLDDFELIYDEDVTKK